MTTDILFGAAVDRDAYYADMLCNGVLTLNQSTARFMLPPFSPKHAWSQHAQLGGHKRRTTLEMEFGTIVDEVLIGGEQRLEVIEADSFRTKAAKESRDAAAARGRTPVKLADMERYRDIAAGAEKALRFGGIDLDDYSKQVCVLWTELASNGAPVQCRALLDLLHKNASQVVDVKTCASAYPQGLGPKSFRMGYDIQSAAYISAIEHVYPDLAGRVSFKNAWIESSWPHVTVVSEPDGEMLHLGRLRWQRAVDLWEECLRTNRWPSYTPAGEVVRIAPPTWAMDDFVLEDAAQ